MTSADILRAESFSLAAALTSSNEALGDAISLVGATDRPKADQTLWRFWHEVCDRGIPAEREFVMCAETAIAGSGATVAFLDQHGSSLLPHQRIRIAILAWPGASPDHRAKLAAAIRGAFSELAEAVCESPPNGYLTRSQSIALQRLVQLGNAFYGRLGAAMTIRPRYQPLLAGPTGSGKSEVARRAAAALGASLVQVSIADWIPVGAREPWSLFTVLDACIAHDKVLLFVDELDKARSAFTNTWSQAIAAEVFAVLDKRPPLHAYCRARQMSEDNVSARVERALFIVGAGTWQEVWTTKSAVGFGTTSNEPTFNDLLAARAIPEELLLRFAVPPLVLTYPNAGEAQEMFSNAGIVQLAELAGVSIDARNHDFSRGGMRSVESLVTDLLLKAALVRCASNGSATTHHPS